MSNIRLGFFVAFRVNLRVLTYARGLWRTRTKTARNTNVATCIGVRRLSVMNQTAEACRANVANLRVAEGASDLSSATDSGISWASYPASRSGYVVSYGQSVLESVLQRERGFRVPMWTCPVHPTRC